MKKPKRLRAFTKHDKFKSRLDLLPAGAFEFIGHVLRNGADKYSVDNWRKCQDPARYIGPILRHVAKHMQGQFLDKESNLPHLAHAVCSGLFALDLYLKGVQDRFTMGNYFAIVKRRAKGRGVVIKRFTDYSRAWEYSEAKGLNTEGYVIKTVTAKEKTGSKVKI